jgi:hypothetical protein
VETQLAGIVFLYIFQELHTYKKSRHFNHVLDAMTTLYTEFVKPTSLQTPLQIRKNPKFFPYFENCIGALDGTHIVAKVPTEKIVPFRNRKRFISQNVLAVCKFNLEFT